MNIYIFFDNDELEFVEVEIVVVVGVIVVVFGLLMVIIGLVVNIFEEELMVGVGGVIIWVVVVVVRM